MMSSYHVGESSTSLGAGSVSSTPKRKLDSSRPKNLQACDRCRTKKTKCESVTGRPNQCHACETCSLSCTFNLPLTASRTKRVKNKKNTGDRSTAASTGTDALASGDEDHEEDSEDVGSRSDIRPSVPPIGGSSRIRHMSMTPSTSTSVRREGPTAMSFVLHSTPTIPLAIVTEHAQTHGQSMYRHPPESNDGFILITAPTSTPFDPGIPVLEALQSDSWIEVVNRLVETFLVHVSPLLPVVERDEVGEAGQLLLHAMAGVAAARTNCPREIFEALRYIIRKDLLEQDTLSDQTRHNVQILLVTCLVDELSLQNGKAPPASIARSRLSAAIRMAQDLSMDNPSPSHSLAQADRRIWQCALIIDQWNAARHGIRPILSPESHIKQLRQHNHESNHFLQQLSSLTHLLSRIMAGIYGSEGIKTATNEVLNAIRDDLSAWRDKLPQTLKFTGVWSSLQAGILHILYSATFVLFYRPFMRWSFIVPSELELDLDIPVWVHIHSASKASLEWAANQDELADLLFFGPYALCLSALIQYHTWARRREWDGVMVLEKAKKEGVDRWLSKWAPGHLPIQRAQLDIITLLHSATEKLASVPTNSFDPNDRGLNPTPGSLNRLPETSIHGVTFLRDPSHPRGGVLVATHKAAQEIKDLPPGTVIIGGPPIPDIQPANQVVDANTGLDQTALGSGFAFNFDTGSASGSNGLFGISTPEWDAAIAAFNFSGTDALQVIQPPQ